MEFDKAIRTHFTQVDFLFCEDKQYEEQLEIQRDILIRYIIEGIYPTEIELYLDHADVGLRLWYDQEEVFIDTGMCTKMITCMLKENLSIHLVLYRETLICLRETEKRG